MGDEDVSAGAGGDQGVAVTGAGAEGIINSRSMTPTTIVEDSLEWIDIPDLFLLQAEGEGGAAETKEQEQDQDEGNGEEEPGEAADDTVPGEGPAATAELEEGAAAEAGAGEDNDEIKEIDENPFESYLKVVVKELDKQKREYEICKHRIEEKKEKLDVLCEQLKDPNNKEDFTDIRRIRKDILKGHKELSPGIKTLTEDIDRFHAEFDKRLSKDSIFTQSYQSSEEGNRVGPEVKRFGINPESFRSLINDSRGAFTAGMLHPAECVVLRQSMDFLKNKCPADRDLEENEFKNNVVVFDFFARKDQVIKTQELAGSIVPEVHTAVLWKITDDQIILIDPNDAYFSQFIIEFFKKKEDYNVTDLLFPGETSMALLEAVKIPNKFYTRGGITPGKDANSRDCIDIAVKIGFEIDEQQRLMTNYEEILNNLTKSMATGDGKKLDVAKRHRKAHSSSKQIRDEYMQIFESYILLIKEYLPSKLFESYD